VTPLERYQSDLGKDAFLEDAEQRRAVEHTQRLYQQLAEDQCEKGPFSRWLNRQQPVRGLYLWGGTGRGKTYLVDCLYECLPFQAKHRIHFHRFMRDIHQDMKALPKTSNPLSLVAKNLSARIRVLCLDEFHVHDIADAMIMGGLLKAMFDNHITLVATSNIPVSELYMNGLQRERFMPAINLLQQHCEEFDIGSGIDYRFRELRKTGAYHTLAGEDGTIFLQNHLAALAPCPPKHNRAITINRRPIQYVALADDVIWFEFQELCNTPRSASDYIEIAQQFHTVFLANVAPMGEGQDDIAKRFMHLVDALYDHHVKLITTAETAPAELYHGRRLVTAFRRTVSRLVEMDTDGYLVQPHLAAANTRMP
jgi:cell division protein ZapE